jgi:hypothetical protein
MRGWLQDALPKIVLAPSFAITLVFVYGFILWTVYLSFTNSKTFPSYVLTGPRAYQRLWRWTFESDPPSSWYTSITNMGIFGFLYIGICLALGLLLAILLDQKIRGEGHVAADLLYPMALSFIVTGVAWKWFLDPGLGLEQTLHHLGLDQLPLRLDQEQGFRDLHRRHRRRLAGLRLRHGDVPCRPARHRRRDHEGSADRRRTTCSFIAASSFRCCGRCSSQPSSCSRIWRSSPTTLSSR